MFNKRLKQWGPAAIITSAFVGPGTITTATQAGIHYGFALLWAVLFSGIASLVIMNMSARLAIVRQQNLITALKAMQHTHPKLITTALLLIGLVALSTGLGFEAGNLLGGAIGLSALTPWSVPISVLALGAISVLAMQVSTPKIIEWLMKTFVFFMGLIFMLTALWLRPAWSDLYQGFIPRIPEGGLLLTLALIGTTIIALNLVFHSLAAQEKWIDSKALKIAYQDTFFHVGIGILITMSIVITTAMVSFDAVDITSPLAYTQALASTLGGAAQIVGALGLVFAGLSSALATPYMVGVILTKLSPKLAQFKTKHLATVVVVVGTIFAFFGSTPVPFIITAQALSGVMLPLIALMFLIMTSQTSMGAFKNRWWQTLIGIFIVLVMSVLGLRLLYQVLLVFL